MSKIEHVTYESTLEVREVAEGDGFTVEGRLVPYNTITHAAGKTSTGSVRSYSESFVRGAFAKTISENRSKVVLRPAHGAAPVGKAISLEERDDGLWGTFRVSDVPAGRDMLTLMRDGVTSELSIEFIPVRHRKTDTGVIERNEVILRGVAATPHPAYQGAAVSLVREFNADDPECAPKLAAARRELLRLRSLAN